MNKYQDWLIDYIERNPNFIQPDFRANETLGFLKSKKLQDLCISRPKRRLKWGIELPFDNEFVTYVWFMLINYISSIGYKSDENLFNSLWPCSCHLIGKDISVYCILANNVKSYRFRTAKNYFCSWIY